MTQDISATAREIARQNDGRFGTQTRADPDLELRDPAATAARYAEAAIELTAEAEQAGYTTVIGQRPDKPHRGAPNEPVVRFTLESGYYVGSVEIAGDTGQVQRRFMSQPVDEFPSTDRFRRTVFPATVQKFREMDTFALQHAEQIAEINRLSATGLTDAPQQSELFS